MKIDKRVDQSETLLSASYFSFNSNKKKPQNVNFALKKHLGNFNVGKKGDTYYTEAAICIQSNWRRLVAERAKYFEIIVNGLMKVRQMAAIEIQKRWRGYRVRCVLHEELSSVVIKWPGTQHSNDVWVTGSFMPKPWQDRVRMKFCSVRLCFVYAVPRLAKEYEFKFICDGQWMCNPNIPIVKSPEGYYNNHIDVHPHPIYAHKIPHFPWPISRGMVNVVERKDRGGGLAEGFVGIRGLRESNNYLMNHCNTGVVYNNNNSNKHDNYYSNNLLPFSAQHDSTCSKSSDMFRFSSSACSSTSCFSSSSFFASSLASSSSTPLYINFPLNNLLSHSLSLPLSSFVSASTCLSNFSSVNSRSTILSNSHLPSSCLASFFSSSLSLVQYIS